MTLIKEFNCKIFPLYGKINQTKWVEMFYHNYTVFRGLEMLKTPIDIKCLTLTWIIIFVKSSSKIIKLLCFSENIDIIN